MNTIYETILTQLKSMDGGIVAIDGRCGSGKTHLGQKLQQALDCNLVHMDDFYLPVNQREPDWKQSPGKNMDFPRLIQQVLEPANRGEAIVYRPYHCGTGTYGPEISLSPQKLTIIEGSYSQFPLLRPWYHKMYFLTCDPAVQLQRLEKREGARLSSFEALWIPLEEAYLRKNPPTGILVDTSGAF